AGVKTSIPFHIGLMDSPRFQWGQFDTQFLNTYTPLSVPGSEDDERLAAIVGAFLARRALAPIDTITETANAITRAHDLSKRIDIRDNASEVGRLAATFNAMLDRIQQLFQAQERLIGDVSHELRTPLTTIQGNIELLQRMAAAPHGNNNLSHAEVAELLQESLNEVKAESERMNKMIS
ncbi:MAG: hypothetical protein CUN48_16415, partial [Candidatus Thermofonsia Clade 3 bacterium]